MWMFGSRTTVKKVRNSLTWFSQYEVFGTRSFCVCFVEGRTAVGLGTLATAVKSCKEQVPFWQTLLFYLFLCTLRFATGRNVYVFCLCCRVGLVVESNDVVEVAHMFDAMEQS